MIGVILRILGHVAQDHHSIQCSFNIFNVSWIFRILVIGSGKLNQIDLANRNLHQRIDVGLDHTIKCTRSKSSEHDHLDQQEPAALQAAGRSKDQQIIRSLDLDEREV
jgi:hypothetical protein